MIDATTLDSVELSPLLKKLRVNKEGAYLFRRRRHNDWTENYTLYRDKVQMNRLLQRQSVNIPLIKTAIKTLLKDIDDAPLLYFLSLDNDEQKEIYYNEYWKFCMRENKLTIQDIVNKRQVLLFGRTFMSMNIVNGIPTFTVDDPQDMLVDRYVNPASIDTARFIIKEHIYKPLASLRENPSWDTNAVKKIQDFYNSDAGLIRAEANSMDFVEKQSRMAEMGVIDVFSPTLGETYVELNEFYIKEWNEQLGEDEIRYIVTCDGMEVLLEAPLEQVMGVTEDHFWRSHYPTVTWSDETERTDFWCDGVADSLRPQNKILNAYYSADVENRTLRNFGMNYYNSSLGDESFTPQTFTPEPWGWYPVPAGEKGLSEAIMHVEIPSLEDNIEMLNFIMTIADKASAATNIQQGQDQGRKITLGESTMLLNNAKERVKSMQVYYTDAWKEFGLKYIKLIDAAPHLLDAQTIHRHGRLTKKMYVKTIDPSHWQAQTGYTVEVKMKSEKQAEDADALQWLNAARSIMPMNTIVDDEYKKILLENANIPDEKIIEALKLDRTIMQQMATAQGQLAQTEHPSEAMNYKDIPPQAQAGMLQQAGLPAGQQQQLPSGQSAQLPAGGQQQPQLPAVSQVMGQH